MIKRTFVVEIHEAFGEKGARPIDMPGADPLGGMAVAHDVLEHFPNDDGSVAAELRALGAALYVRGASGVFYRNGGVRSQEDAIAVEFPDLYRHLVYEGYELARPPRTCRVDEMEEVFDECITKGFRNIRDQEEKDTRKEFLDRSLWLGWLRIGYRRAERRFRRVGYHEAGAMFTKIETWADKFLKHAEEGDRFAVSVSLARRTVKCRPLEIQEEDW